MRTLREVLEAGRHVSWFNVLRWAGQLAGTILWCHARYCSLGELGLDDVWLAPDLLVLQVKLPLPLPIHPTLTITLTLTPNFNP